MVVYNQHLITNLPAVKICHDAANATDLDPFELMAREFSLTATTCEVTASIDMPLDELAPMDWEDAAALGDMHDHELGAFLSEAFGEPCAAVEGLAI